MMKLTGMIMAGLVAWSGALFGSDCPSYIYYSNGNTLKSGSYYYFSNGNQMISGAYVYYSNGNSLKSGSYYYYPNGNTLKSGNYLYYPNGNTLKSGDSYYYYYYANGNGMKSGSYFYYKNGNTARSGSYLYREDGSSTEFPVTLREDVTPYGSVSFVVDKTSEAFSLNLDSLIQDNLVRLGLVPAGSDFTLNFSIGTGHPNEFVQVTLTPAGTTCTLSGTSQPTSFVINHSAATVRVDVNAGYDPSRVRDALQRALDSL